MVGDLSKESTLVMVVRYRRTGHIVLAPEYGEHAESVRETGHLRAWHITALRSPGHTVGEILNPLVRVTVGIGSEKAWVPQSIGAGARRNAQAIGRQQLSVSLCVGHLKTVVRQLPLI